MMSRMSDRFSFGVGIFFIGLFLLSFCYVLSCFLGASTTMVWLGWACTGTELQTRGVLGVGKDGNDSRTHGCKGIRALYE
jgi:hypothetical protein